MDAVEEALTEMAQHPDVRFVSFRQLVDWLEAQDPRCWRGCRRWAWGNPHGTAGARSPAEYRPVTGSMTGRPGRGSTAQ